MHGPHRQLGGLLYGITWPGAVRSGTLLTQSSLPDCLSQGRLTRAPQPPYEAFHACILELTCVPSTPQCWCAEPKGKGGVVCAALSHTCEQPGSRPVALPALGSGLQDGVTLELVGWGY